MAELVLIILWIVVVVILYIRLRISHEEPCPINQKADRGSCMTIGTRELQEDCCGIMENQAGMLAVLADGMGKSYGGRIASKTAVETFKDIFADYNAFDNPPYFFRKAFSSANREILKILDNGQTGSASVGAVVILQDKLYYAVAGNVKICVYRGGELIEMSVGHTIEQFARQGFKTGRISREDAISLLGDHRLYNYVGQDEFQNIELYDSPITLKNKDVVTIMSDGVYELLSWKDIEDVLETGQSCRSMAFEIIQKINQLGTKDKDNASVALIRI